MSALSKMEAIETIVSLQIPGELEAFAPKPLIVGRGLTKVYCSDAFESVRSTVWILTLRGRDSRFPWRVGKWEVDAPQ